MIKTLKSNKIAALFLISICIIIIFNPLIYAKSFLNGVTIWAFKILPLLFPFFILSKLIVSLLIFTEPADKLNKKFNFFNCIVIFFLSALAGYPMGAKLVANQFQDNQLDHFKSKIMLAFCSVSGPMFIIGTVGLGFLCSAKAGVIILISNLVGAFLNGLFWLTVSTKNKCQQHNIIAKDSKGLQNHPIQISDIVYDSLVSILMVGAYVSLSFVLIEILSQLNIIKMISNAVHWVSFKSLDLNIIESFVIGLIEITCGIFNLSQIQCSLFLKTIVSSCLIGFGGFSVLLQNLSILSPIKINAKYVLKQKISHSFFSLLIAILLCFCFLC